MPPLSPHLIESIWELFSALLPEREVNRPLGCHKPRVPDLVVFEKSVSYGLILSGTGSLRYGKRVPSPLGRLSRLRLRPRSR